MTEVSTVLQLVAWFTAAGVAADSVEADLITNT